MALLNQLTWTKNNEHISQKTQKGGYRHTHTSMYINTGFQDYIRINLIFYIAFLRALNHLATSVEDSVVFLVERWRCRSFEFTAQAVFQGSSWVELLGSVTTTSFPSPEIFIVVHCQVHQRRRIYIISIISFLYPFILSCIYFTYLWNQSSFTEIKKCIEMRSIGATTPVYLKYEENSYKALIWWDA